VIVVLAGMLFAGAFAPDAVIATTRFAPSQPTFAPSACETKRSGTYVDAPMMNGATSTVCCWPSTVACWEPIFSEML